MFISNSCNHKPFTLGVLPSSYMESMTFLEKIICLNNKINEIIDYLKDFSIDEIERLIQQNINNLQNYVDIQDKKLYDYINEISEQNKSYTDDQLNIQINLLKELLNSKILFLLDYINSSNDILKLELEQKINDLKNQIDDIIINGINVYDPTSGKVDNIQNVIYNIYSALRYHGISAIQFDNLNLTAEQFDIKLLSARNFDLYSKDYLLIDFNYNMFSPFDGEITPITTIINQLANFHKEPITAKDFDNLQLTAQTFDNKDLTAYQFDWQAKTLLNI